MKIRTKLKKSFKIIVILMFVMGMIPVGTKGLLGQVSVVQAATNIIALQKNTAHS